MSIVRLEEVRREIGTFVILDSISAAVAHGERIGLVGANGAGKTTLLRIVAGRDEPDRGRVIAKGGLTIGLLTQEAHLDPLFAATPTVREGVRAGAAEVERLERELAALEAAGSAAVQGPEYASLQARFEALDGYSLDQRVDETLSGLGIDRVDRERPPLQLSGGEQTRAALARLLVADPDLLLLDEPTNHLDVSAMEWLEQALVRRRGSLLVAAHDRAFLDAVVDRVWELRDRRISPFRGAYSAYLVQREALDARQRKEAETQEQAAVREQELIQRYRSQRKFTKMHEHERRLANLERIEAPRAQQTLRLPTDALLGGGPVRSGEAVLSLRDLLAGFPAADGKGRVPIVSVARLDARRGDRIGIVGPNGAGKTTLLRTIAGDLPQLEGTVRLGAAVQPGYLAQLRGRDFPGTTVLDALLSVASVDFGPARSYLARFLFRGEEVFKPVKELSGGERSRLELALLGITRANLLLLDEPTNHLDIPAREALEAFLRDSPATLLIVSHDRRLLESVCGTLWVVEPGPTGPAATPGRVAPFDGGYRAWRSAVAEGWTVERELELQARRLDGRGSIPARAAGHAAGGAPGAANGRVGGGKASESTDGGRGPAATRTGARGGTGTGTRRGTGAGTRTAASPLSKDAYRRQRASVEEDMTRLGLRKTHLELALNDPSVQANFVELRRVTSELADVDAALAQAEDTWLALADRAPR